MASEENKFKNGKIYRIVSEDNSMIYYGSTVVPLSNRMTSHKSFWNSFKNGRCNFISCFEIFDKFGFDRIKIELVELYPCENNTELKKRERYYIENNTCINRNIPSRTRSETYKIWAKNNRDRVREIALASYHRRADKVNARLREKLPCSICSKMLCRDNMTRHIRMMHPEKNIF